MNIGKSCPLPLSTLIGNFRIYLYIVSLVVILSNWVCDNWVYRFPTIYNSKANNRTHKKKTLKAVAIAAYGLVKKLKVWSRIAIAFVRKRRWGSDSVYLRRAGSDPLHVGPAGNHSSVFPCWVGISAKLRLVLAICVWYVVCLFLSCLAVPAMLLKFEWAKRRNTLLGRKTALRMMPVFCVSGAVPRAGSSLELSVLWSPGMTSQKTGAAHGPRHPSCLNNQDISASS